MVVVQKRRIRWAISLFLVMLYFSGLTAQAQYEYGGGSGEPNDPYLIYTAEQMNTIGLLKGLQERDSDKHFKLMADIDLSSYTGTNFNIIGISGGASFKGVFDGNGHRISNFSYTSTDRDYVGLFGHLRGVIKDLGLIEPNIDVGTEYYVGSLVGSNRGTISNCYVQGGSVSCSSSVGGLVGSNSYDGTITNCYASGSVTGEREVGGLVGFNGGGTITNCYATGSVSGNEHVGGLVGVSNGGTITNCYSTGSVSGKEYVGGLVGSNSGTTTNCYSSGSVTGDENVGGLVGSGYADNVYNSFWDTQTSGQVTSAGGTGKTTAEMQIESTFTDAGWDFVGESVNGTEDTWRILEGQDYPHLWWEKYGGGSGESNDPYLIYTTEQMNDIGANPNDWDKHFKLMADIDLSAYSGTQFNIIGIRSGDDAFRGVFDGNGHTISNFSYISTDTDCIGLFGYICWPVEIIDLGLIDPNVDAGTGVNVGLLVGWLIDGTISNCYVEGGSVSGGGEVGGLVGINWDGTITNCYSTGSVTGTRSVGGLVGKQYCGTVTNCYATGSVWGDEHVGGLVGGNNYGTISNCYSSGDISGDSAVGGLVGALDYGTITNCYSTGSVSGDSGIGGLVGLNTEGPVTSSFWDIETSGQTTSDGGTGKTTAEMQMASTFLNASWDFVDETANGTEDIWRICEGTNYPRLVWQIAAGDFICPDGITIEDFLFFAEYLGDDNCDEANYYCEGTDLDFSGTVDEADLEILVDNWLAVGND